MTDLIHCPKCNLKFGGPCVEDSEQAICIEMYGECRVCRCYSENRRPWGEVDAEFLLISHEAIRRREQFLGLMV